MIEMEKKQNALLSGNQINYAIHCHFVSSVQKKKMIYVENESFSFNMHSCSL